MDEESRKRKLQSLLAAGRSSGTSKARDASRNVAATGVPGPIQQAPVPSPEGGGFFRDRLQNATERATIQPVQAAVPVQPEQDEDSDDGIDDALMDLSETLLAIKALSQLFPRRAAPRNCPNLVLHSQLQDYLQGSHNLELDQELQKLQDSCDIVVLKFSAAGSDSVVILWSEFEQSQAVDGLCTLLRSGAFRVQMPEARLAHALTNPSTAGHAKRGSGAHSMEDAARRADVLSRRNAGKRRRRACAQDASSSSSSEEDEEADARKGDASAPGAAAAAGGRAGGQTGGKTVVPPSGDELLGALVRAGLLVRHSTGTVAMMRLSAPGVGSVMAAVERARRELQVSLKRRRNREVGQKTLVETPPRSSRFGWEWHLRDAAGKGLVTRVTRGNNTVIRLAQTQ